MANLKSFRISAAGFPFHDFTVSDEPFQILRLNVIRSFTWNVLHFVQACASKF